MEALLRLPSLAVDTSSRQLGGSSSCCCCKVRNGSLRIGAMGMERPSLSTQRPVGARNPLKARLAAGQVSTEEEEEVEASSAAPPENDKKVLEWVMTLKAACKTKKVPPTEVFTAVWSLGKAKLDPSNFRQTIGGTGTPRTWMLVFTAGAKVVSEAIRGGPGGGTYFPFTAVQQFDAATGSIENGVYLGPLGVLKFQGRFSWDKRLLAFIFDTVSVAIGPLGPFRFNVSKKEDRERAPNKKDPCFIWFYADDEIIVGKGRGGGVAVWVRCTRV